MNERRVAVTVNETNVDFMPKVFSIRVFGNVKTHLSDTEFPAALEKTSVVFAWIIEFFQHESPWDKLKVGDVVTFSAGPSNRIKLTVSDGPTETGVAER